MASKANSPEDEWAQTGAASIEIAPLAQSRKEQILIITLAKGTGEHVTVEPPKGGAHAGTGQSLTWSGAYTDKFLLELQDAKFTPGPFMNRVGEVIINAEIKSPVKKSFAADSKDVLTWGQTIAVNLHGPGKYTIYQDEKNTGDSISIVFTANEAVPKVDKEVVPRVDKKIAKASQTNIYTGPPANVWRSKITGKKTLDKDMNNLANTLSRVRLTGKPWKKGIKNITIITSDSKPPSTATKNIVRYEFDGIKIANPKFPGIVGNTKKPIALHYVIASRWLIKRGYLSFADLKAIANKDKYKALQENDDLPGRINVVTRGQDRRLKRRAKRRDRNGELSEGIEDIDFGEIGKGYTSLDNTGKTVALGTTGDDPYASSDNATNDELRQDGETEIDIDTDTNVDIDADVKSRVLKISAATGIKPEAIYGIERTESSGNPSGFAFNDQIFRRYLETEEEIDLANQIKISNAKIAPRYGNNAKVTFEKAYQINPEAAVKAGAWGWYQVLGETSLKLYGNDPDTFISAFKSNPMEHSINSFIAWVKDRGSSFVNVINNDDHRAWVKMYYGPRAFDPGQSGDKYVDRYIKAKNQWKV